MRLKPMRVPDALDGPQADADRLGDSATGPVRGVAGRFRTRQRKHFSHHLRRQRCPAGLARLVTEQPIKALLGIALLPAPHRRAASPAAPCNIKDGQAIGRIENDPRPLHMLLRPVTIADDRRQLRSLFNGENEANSLSHTFSMARFANSVNLLNASVH